MEKTVVSGGGGGSDGAAVTLMEELIAEAKARTPPPGAFTVDEYLSWPGMENTKRAAALSILESRCEKGTLACGKFYNDNSREQWYYWPVNPKAKPPAKKARK